MHRSRIDWSRRLEKSVADLPPGPILRGFIKANCEAFESALAAQAAETGAHVVMNIAAVHVPTFCADRGDTAYKNFYDLGRHLVGDANLTRREVVDQSLPLPQPGDYRQVYFGAVELNGTGIRYYGDICFVLKHGIVEPDTVILDRNSYDLDREPYRTIIAGDATKRQEAAHEISGSWSESLHHVACLKSFDRIATRLRRLTTGEISDAVLSDEDYIEVLWMRRDGRGGSFGATDLLEARLSAADAALEERIDSRARRGPFASYEELLWRASRRDAEMALRDAGVPVRVVTTTGRVRS